MPRKLAQSAAALAVVIAVTAAVVSRPNRPEPPADVPALISRLKDKGVRLTVVPMRDNGDLRAGVYLVDGPAPERVLRRWLCRVPESERAAQWAGVVFVEASPNPSVLEDSWGDHGLRVGDLLFFGDPELLARIDAALRE